MNQDVSVEARSSVYKMLRKLGSMRAGLRAAAEEALRHLTDDQVDALVQISRSENKKGGRRLLIAIGVYAVACLSIKNYWNAIPALWQWLFIFSLPVDYILFLRMIARPGLINSIMRALTVAGDPRVLGPLISKSSMASRDSVRWRVLFSRLIGYNPDLHAAAVAEIQRIVSCVQPGDEIDIHKSERLMLQLALRSPNTEYVLALLRLLEVIGDNRELPGVRALEHGSYTGANSVAIREAAARCREIVEARLAHRTHPATLLRASQSDTISDELVRPSAQSSPEDADLLLRAGNPEDAA